MMVSEIEKLVPVVSVADVVNAGELISYVWANSEKSETIQDLLDALHNEDLLKGSPHATPEVVEVARNALIRLMETGKYVL